MRGREGGREKERGRMMAVRVMKGSSGHTGALLLGPAVGLMVRVGALSVAPVKRVGSGSHREAWYDSQSKGSMVQ